MLEDLGAVSLGLPPPAASHFEVRARGAAVPAPKGGAAGVLALPPPARRGSGDGTGRGDRGTRAASGGGEKGNLKDVAR